MCPYEKETDEALKMPYKNHGPGGELPTFTIVSDEPAKAQEAPKPAKKCQPMDASWVPVKKPTELGNLVECAKHMLCIAAASGIVFYWQQTQQLAEAAGYYALIVLAAFGGLTIGKYLMR